MSERGSFVTEFVYCGDCFEHLKKVLCFDEKYLKGVVIPSWLDTAFHDLPIIAGKIGGLYSGEELHFFEFELVDEISKGICHPVRIAVLAETGEKIFTITPEEGTDED